MDYREIHLKKWWFSLRKNPRWRWRFEVSADCLENVASFMAIYSSLSGNVHSKNRCLKQYLMNVAKLNFYWLWGAFCADYRNFSQIFSTMFAHNIFFCVYSLHLKLHNISIWNILHNGFFFRGHGAVRGKFSIIFPTDKQCLNGLCVILAKV